MVEAPRQPNPPASDTAATNDAAVGSSVTLGQPGAIAGDDDTSADLSTVAAGRLLAYIARQNSAFRLATLDLAGNGGPTPAAWLRMRLV